MENLEWIYLRGLLVESTCDTNDYKPREEDLYVVLGEGWSRYNTLRETNTIRVVVVEVDRELYDIDDGIKTEDSIRKMLIKVD